MPRKLKKHHQRRETKTLNACRNNPYERALENAYNNFAGETLQKVSDRLERLSPDSSLAKGYFLALKIETIALKVKFKKGETRRLLMDQKATLINMFISHCEMHHFRVEKAHCENQLPQKDILHAYLPGCAPLTWYCCLGKLPIKEVSVAIKEGHSTNLQKLEAAILSEFS